jgi:hypothetical protein
LAASVYIKAAVADGRPVERLNLVVKALLDRLPSEKYQLLAEVCTDAFALLFRSLEYN